MKLKNVLTIILAFIIMINMSVMQVVRAEGKSKNAEPTNETLKLLPDTITLNVKESEFYADKCFEEQERIRQSIENTLLKAGVDMTGWDIDLVFRDFEDWTLKDIHTATIAIFNLEQEKELTKVVKVKYSNSANYNAADEKVVKDIANIFESCWTAYDFGKEIPYIEDSFEDFMKKYITDKSITYEYSPLGMGWQVFTSFTNMETLFFKNDICYAIKMIPYQTNRMITIPENIKDTEQDYINYAMPIIKKEMNNAIEALDDFKLEKQKDNGSWFNILEKNYETGEYEVCDWVLIKKESTPLSYELGDVNLDGTIDAQDAVQILKYVAHNINLTSEQLKLADTNKDGNVDAQDAVQILKYVAHNITEF